MWGAFWLFTPLLIDPLPIVDGGSATTLFTVVGIVVMLGTAMLYLREKNA